MEECLVPAHRNQHFQWLGATTEMPKMRKVELRPPPRNRHAVVPAGQMTKRHRAIYPTSAPSVSALIPYAMTKLSPRTYQISPCRSAQGIPAALPDALPAPCPPEADRDPRTSNFFS